jgi:hypothetical protein
MPMLFTLDMVNQRMIGTRGSIDIMNKIENKDGELLISSDMELEMLREFYLAWVHLHSLPRDIEHKKQMEHAAQRLVDAGHVVAEFRKLSKNE